MEPMARDAIEATGSMGNDATIAVVSDRPQHMFTYFKQLFAQVSNPPLDAIREELVTQLSVPAGTRQNLFEETPLHARVLRIDHPIMTNADLAKLRALDGDGFHSRTISHAVPGHGRHRRPPQRPRPHPPRGERGRRGWSVVDRPLRPRRGRPAHLHPVAAGRRRAAPPPDPRAHTLEGRPDPRDGRPARGASLRHPVRVWRGRCEPVPRVRVGGGDERELPRGRSRTAAAGGGRGKLHQGASRRASPR